MLQWSSLKNFPGMLRCWKFLRFVWKMVTSLVQDGNWASIVCFGGCLWGFLFYKMKNQTPEVLSWTIPFFSFLTVITGIRNTFTSRIKHFKHGLSSISLLCFHRICWAGRDLVKCFIVFRQLTVTEKIFSKERGNGGVINTKIQVKKGVYKWICWEKKPLLLSINITISMEITTTSIK